MTEIKTKTIKCEGGLPAFIAQPAIVNHPLPAIVLIHERYGLVQHTLDLAVRFAHDGFVCIAPDCFFRHPNQEGLHAGEERYDITDDEAAELLGSSIKALEGMTEVNSSCIAVKGVCLTGRHPLIFAARQKIAAALVWYGAAQDREWDTNELYPEALDDVIAKVDCPVLGMFGEADHMISIDDVRRFRDCLERKGKSHAIHIFPGAPHGWLNDTMPGRYRREQAEAAWQVQLAFLSEVLSPAYNRNKIYSRYDCAISQDYDFSKNVRQE